MLAAVVLTPSRLMLLLWVFAESKLYGKEGTHDKAGDWQGNGCSYGIFGDIE